MDAPSAVCPRHARPATGNCTRCGIFVCETCAAAREPLLCGPCEARRRDTGLLLGAYSFGAAFRSGLALLRARWSLVVGLSAVFTIPEVAIDLLAQDAGVRNTVWIGNLCSATFGLVAALGCLNAMVASAEGRPMSAGEALRAGARSWPRVFAARLLAGIHIALWSLALIVPGIVRSVQLALVTPLALLQPNTDALETSTSLTAGSRWSLFGLIVATNFAAVAAIAVPAVALGALGEYVPVLAIPCAYLSTWLANAALVFPEAATLAAYFALRQAGEEDGATSAAAGDVAA